MKPRFLFAFLVFWLSLCALLFQMIYTDARRQAIAELNARQRIYVEQARRGIENFFTDTIAALEKMAASSHVVALDAQGRQEMDFALHIDPHAITAVTRVDAEGRIVYSTPAVEGVVGRDISAQRHMARIIETRRPVVSDVFQAVQGYPAVALHVPVLEAGAFRGTLGVLVDFKTLARRHLEAIRLGETGYAWMTSAEGVELYCPVPGHIGRSVFENCRAFPTILDMAREMLAGREGVTTYRFDRIREQKTETIKKHAVYMPIRVGDTFWSIVVASSETEVLATLTNFRDKLVLIVLLLLGGSAFLSVYGLRSWSIAREETRRREAEGALRERDALHRSVTETVDEGIVLQAASGEILTWNRGAERIFGIPAAAVVGRTSAGEDWPTIREDGSAYPGREHPSGRTLATGRPCRNEIMGVIQPSGARRWISVNTNPLFRGGEARPHAVAISFSDITERKRAEDSLRHERDLMQRIMETSPAGITRVDADGRIVYANRRAEVILGLKSVDIARRTYSDPQWRITDFEGNPFPEERLPFAVVRRTGAPVSDVRHAIQWPDGRRTLLSINATPLLNADGAFDGIVATIDDVTERYEAEERYRTLFREMIDGFAIHEIICDERGEPVDYRFLAVNPAFERLTGLKAEALVGRTVREVMPNIETVWIERYGRVALTGEPASFESHSGELGRYFQVTAFRHGRDQFACIFVDTTERRRFEERLQQVQKMEAIGNLAGGIAHDFNNLLFPIVGMAEMLLEDLPPGSPARESVQEIYRAGRRASDLVKQILAFSRQSEHRLIPVHVQQVLKEVLKLARATIPSNIEIVRDLQPDCGLVRADPTQVHQVAMNLITNAYHAVAEAGGRIEVALAEVTLEADVRPAHPLAPGRYVRLTVADTGTGIAPEIMDKIFEPYFTTKEKGKGTGLGLATVYGIVHEHGGDVRVRSRPGEGTTFDVYLPRMETADRAPAAERAPIEPTGDERILLVDDEEPVARLERQILERLGYRVTAFRDSPAALETFRADPQDFDLVVTDMAMPQMTGEELAARLIAVRPDIPVIICTGFSERIDADKARRIGIRGFLMKPVVKSEMARMVREVLDAAGSLSGP